jgi:TPP-dependent trihydroxycyclohexane-1,2-dione (THcHDO) dehydratase
MKEQVCQYCNDRFSGRPDKKFCSGSCRSAYHYHRNLEKQESLFRTIDKKLKANRKILKEFNKAGKATVRKEVLIEAGFSPGHFTHYWRAKNGNVYLFCYEYGFMTKKESGKEKYVLIQWQPYME